jgi:acyl-CoA thioester hydrolase
MTRHVPSPRTAYRHFLPITTRWMDNDVYGHVNNVIYYSYFDTVVNEYLIRAGVLDVEHGATIVRYEVGLFKDGEEQPAAEGHFVHVYVDRATRRPVPLPAELRAALAPLVVATE